MREEKEFGKAFSNAFLYFLHFKELMEEENITHMLTRLKSPKGTLEAVIAFSC